MWDGLHLVEMKWDGETPLKRDLTGQGWARSFPHLDWQLISSKGVFKGSMEWKHGVEGVGLWRDALSLLLDQSLSSLSSYSSFYEILLGAF